jgi:cytochrome c
MSCHAVEAKVLGPSFKEIAAKYKDSPGAADQLASKIRLGGGGVWGAVKMPANTQVSEADAKKLAAWVLSVR